MQQWFDVVRAVGNLLALAAAAINFVSAITQRRPDSRRPAPGRAEN